ncbi:LacI family DNA-binding transcriptional regulator [Microbacterium xanthum]|uniref:LacI family DNA-binding transcriptional regulator n=1 Tax=Microbacterium xanthum TaxID=3079794 RepID=UPI002AD437B5|nr:LacI family DNA-binding transcriptional regulator [Microbacterium sp. KSW-48]MDZ8172999.1 LacI family DNA-binding transcriptional regulator [Microbacterium sp. KSW-48]
MTTPADDMRDDAGRARRVTRADVARAAGVSTAVVSYVMNDGPRPVAPETAERVRAVMANLGYRPNFTARALNLGTTRTLGLVLQDTLNPFFAELAQSLERAASARGYHLVVAESHGDADTEHRLVAELADRQVDGLLLMSSGDRRLDRVPLDPRDPPTVLLDCAGPVPGRHTIGPDAAAGAHGAVSHLIQMHDRRRIGLVIGPDGLASPDPRVVGWREALAAHEASEGPLAVEAWSAAGGYRAARRLLETGMLPDALFVSSDVQAVGVLRALLEGGIDIPRDCPLVSFDGTRVGEYSWPALTSARQPVGEMADLALDLLTGSVDARPGTTTRHHVFPVELVLRESCGCPLTPPSAASDR